MILATSNSIVASMQSASVEAVGVPAEGHNGVEILIFFSRSSILGISELLRSFVKLL